MYAVHSVERRELQPGAVSSLAYPEDIAIAGSRSEGLSVLHLARKPPGVVWLGTDGGTGQGTDE